MELRRRIRTALASLVIATVIWLIVDNLDRSPARLTVSLVHDVPSDVIVTEGAVREVEVRVLATKPRLRTLQPSEFDIHVPWRGTIGSESVVLLPDDVDAPFGVTVEQVQPSRFTVVYDRKLVRSLVVRPDIKGEPADGHEVVAEGVTIVPSRVTVAGPALAFRDDAIVTTSPIDISGREATLGPIRAALRPPPGGFSPVDATDVAVTVPIRAIPARRTLEIPVQLERGAWRTSSPSPSSVRIVLEGPETIVKKLAASSIRAVADARDLEPRTEAHRIEPSVDLGGACPTCRVVSMTPARVSVRVRRTPRAADAANPSGSGT